MDATSPDSTIRRQGIERLRVCISALKEMGTTWSWSYQALRAIQLLACQWLAPHQFSRGSTPHSTTHNSPCSQDSDQQHVDVIRMLEIGNFSNIPPTGAEESVRRHSESGVPANDISLLSQDSPSSSQPDDIDWLFNYAPLDPSTWDEIFVDLGSTNIRHNVWGAES